MKTVKEKLLEMRNRDFISKQHELTMELFDHHTYTKEKAFEEGYKAAIDEILKSLVDTPVREFHSVFNHHIEAVPKVPKARIRALRVKLILEELLEFAAASGVHISAKIGSPASELDISCDTELFFGADIYGCDVVEAADALGDLRYVVDGANLVWGFPMEAILYEIHRSNMSKLGEDGQPIYREDGKVQKGPNFTKPNLEHILIEHGWEK